jgi:hypothetical protein
VELYVFWKPNASKESVSYSGGEVTYKITVPPLTALKFLGIKSCKPTE